MTSVVRLRSLLVAASALAVLGTVKPALAVSSCLSRPYGVPGLSGAPLWIDPVPAGSNVKKTNLDDPRWAGSTRLYFPTDTGSGVATEATVRALVEGTTLVLSYQTNVDLGADAGDTIWLGIGKNATKAALSASDNDYFLVQLSLGPTVAAAGTDDTPIDPTSVQAWTNTGTTPAGWTASLAHPWFDTSIAHYWVGGGTTKPYKWAVNVKIDLAAVGIDASTLDAKLFIASFVDTSFSQGWIHQWPVDVVAVLDPTMPVIDFSESAVRPLKWGDISLATYATPCTDGITLSSMQIGASPAPDNIINTDAAASSHADNVYFANPSWNSFASDPNTVKARFRIANWGSQIADPNAPWDDITPATPVENNAAGLMSFTCPVGTAKCGHLDAGHDPHQCMLVELSKGSASTSVPLKFAQDSVYRNMDFDTASQLEREAEISIRGLKPLQGTTARDVYLLVKTTNMPAASNEQKFLPVEAMKRDADLAQNPPKRPMQPPHRGGEGNNNNNDKQPANIAGTAELASKGAPTPIDPALAKDGFEHMEESWPTYEVHAYHDTGKSVIVRGKKYKLLDPQVPFGYFVSHSGSFFGFDHSIEGIGGAKLEQIAPDFYRVSVANDGVVRVKSTIVAYDKPKAPPPPPGKVEVHGHCNCGVARTGSASDLLAALAAAFGLTFTAVYRRRRKARPSTH